MKILFASSTLAAALAAAPVHAADAPAPRPVIKTSPVLDALVSMAYEVQTSVPSKLPARERLDALVEFRHSPATAQKLLKVYGTERPWTLARLPVANGRYDYIGTLAPLHYTGESGETYDWAPLTMKIATDKASRNLTISGALPSVVTDDKTTRFALRDMSMTSKLKRGFGDVWFGDTQVRIGSAAFDAKTAGTSITIDDISLRSSLVERPKTVDLASETRVRAINAGGEKIDNVRFAMRMTNIDKKAMAELKAISDKANSAAGTPEQRLAAIQPIFKTMGKAIIQRGAAIEIDEISAGYKGNTASVKGRVTVDGATEADLDAMPALLKKVVARFSIRLPAAMLRDFTTLIATKQASAQANAPANPQAAAQVAQSMYDIMIGKIVGNGYARMEKDVLLTEIDIRGGVVRVNGKEVALPNMNATPPLPAPSPAIMPVRRVVDRCVLPDYPDDVVRGERQFGLSIRFIVKADGSVANPLLVKSSGDRDYDQGVLAAMARCVYIPALIDGKAVDMPTTWNIKREPGETRP